MDIKDLIHTEISAKVPKSSHSPTTPNPPTPTAQYRPSGLPNGDPSSPYTRNSISASTSPQVSSTDGKRKRSVESAEAAPGPPIKVSRPNARPQSKRKKPAPVWAMPAKGTPLLTKYQNRPLPNRARSTSPSVNGVLRQSQTPQPSQPASSVSHPQSSPFEETFDGGCPSDEVVRQICDFLFYCLMTNDTLDAGEVGAVPSSLGQLEIEAKIGTLIDRQTGARLQLPVRTESVIADGMDISFVSDMTMDQHRKTNEYLNKQVELTKAVQYKMAGGQRSPVDYKRSREVDTFHDMPPGEIQKLPPVVRDKIQANTSHFRPKLRVTRDLTSGQVLATIIKTRIKDIHVHNADRRFPFDWRISINVEMNWEGDLKKLLAETAGDVQGEASFRREKNRVSYRHLKSQIDLTQVTPSPDAARKGEGPSHELEVELDSQEAKRQFHLVIQGQPNQYENLVKGFVNNVRILSGKGGFLA